MAKIRKKKCKVCQEKFQPDRPMQPVCSIPCAIAWVNQQKEKKQRKQDRKAREDLKTKPQLTKEAQMAFNPWIRFRDRNEPCISCGKYDHEILSINTGGKWDCGHYLSVGSHPELRFNEDNAHKQCKVCNGGSGRFAKKNRTVSQEYRDRLIDKIGIERVEWLEGPHEQKKLTRTEIMEIRDWYRKKLREDKREDAS